MREHSVRPGILVCSAIGLLLIGFGSTLVADTYPRQPGIDARHYAVRLTLLTDDSNEIQAEATVTLRVVTPGTREAVLDLTSRDVGWQGDDGDRRHIERPRHPD